ncbi:MAG: chemotaxis protein CheW, partial [Hungatella sp.]
NIETNIVNIEDGILVWVESGDKSYCLFLDELLGEQQVVVKPLPVFLNTFNIKHSGITGCTILGDGNISIILDILTLYDVAHNQY